MLDGETNKFISLWIFLEVIFANVKTITNYQNAEGRVQKIYSWLPTKRKNSNNNLPNHEGKKGEVIIWKSHPCTQ